MSRTRAAIIWVGAIGAIAAFLWAVTDSKSFGDCIHHHKNYHAYHALHEKAGYFIIAFARIRLHLACGFIAAHDNGEAVTAVGTLAIAAFTGTLWWATLGMMRVARDQRADTLRSIKVAESTARAAEKSADIAERSLIGIERPRLFITVPPSVSIIFPVSIRYRFTNYGKTPAIVDHLVVMLFPYPDPPPLPSDELDNPVLTQPKVRYLNPVIMHNEDTPEFTVDLAYPASAILHNEIMRRLTTIWFYGYIRYDDVFDDTHTTYFCFEFDPAIHMMVPHGGHVYNFTKTEQRKN